MVNDYRQLISALRNSTWLIIPESLETILEIVNMRLEGKAFSDDEIRLRLSEVDNGDRENSRVEVGGGIGVVSLYGPIFPKANLMTELSGATSLEAFQSDINMLLNDDSVNTIVMDVDSPGGVDSLVPETAAMLREAREQKPIYAVANTVAGSAAYYLAAQATKFYATQSGKVGSIGVYTVHEDLSAQDKNEGRKVTFISSGKFKTAGNEHEPLDEETRAYIQALVDDSMDLFVENVALGRGVSEDAVREYADGRIFTAKSAVEMGMIDGVKSLQDVVGELVVENQPQVRGTLQNVLLKHQKALEVATTSGITPDSIKTSHVDKTKEGRMNEEQLRALLNLSADVNVEQYLTDLRTRAGIVDQLRTGLNLGEEVDDDTLVTTVRDMHSEIVPIREAQSQAEKQHEFAKAFPEEHARMQRLEAKDRKVEARTFAEQYERFNKADGDRVVKSSVGFPMVTINKIEDLHLSISERKFTHEMLGELLDLIAGQGFVDFSEKGSSRLGETLSEDPIKQFASRIESLMSEDNMTPQKATRLAITKWPQEYEAYREAQSAKSKTTA